MAFIGLIVVLAALGMLILNRGLHRILGKKPILGLLLFLLLGLGLGYYYRMTWQVYGLYLLIALLALEYFALMLLKNKKLRVTVRFNARIYVICTYMALLCAYLFPITTALQSPEGLPVGSWKLVVESGDRVDKMAEVSGLKRRYAVTLFYPIEADQGKRKTWLEGDASIRGMALSYGLPEFFLSHLKSTHSEARQSKQISSSDAALPVVIISHGTKSSSEQFTRLAEALAAEGCVVAVINHPYSAYATIYSDKEYVLGARSMAAQLDFVDQKIELERQLSAAQQGDLIETFKLLDRINQGEYDNRFKNKLDLSDMILVGHQLGGGSVLATLNQMPFLSSAVLLNPVVEQLPRTYIMKGSEKPVIGLLTEDYLASNNASYLSRYLKSSAKAYVYKPQKGKDLDMLEMPSLSPLFSLKGLSAGQQARQQIFEAQLRLCLEAVDTYARGQIFKELDENIDSEALDLVPLSPEEVYAVER